ncbi:class I fructose-bisphosphate aldolase [Hypericibacter sp.]|uniref:class I fructose-bisphosphate aldolase n=1 Tax=Hypericibacter sp. TaxID=2705401 RepID=UPI003D6CAD07
MHSPDFLAADGKSVIIAIDHTLYSWPCPGLEDRGQIIDKVAEAGADGIIASYGTIRDFRQRFGRAAPILKMDITTLTMGTNYALTEYVMAYTIEDAQRLGVKTTLTYIQLGAPFELEALRQAAILAARCDKAGMAYLCEIMPTESKTYPDPAAPEAIIAACRTGAELGGHAIKTTMPVPSAAIVDAVKACGVPVILAGGAFAKDRQQLMKDVATAIGLGAAGVAFGRNAWGASDPGAVVSSLRDIIHPKAKRG